MERYDPTNPEDLAWLTKNGFIWKTSYVQMGLDALLSGAIDPAECKDIPPQVQAILDRKAGTVAAPADATAPALPEPVPAPEPAPLASTGWVCPTHGSDTVTLRSRKGRVYGLCMHCEEFEGGKMPSVPGPGPKVTPKQPSVFVPAPTVEQARTPLGRIRKLVDDVIVFTFQAAVIIAILIFIWLYAGAASHPGVVQDGACDYAARPNAACP